MEMRCTNGFSLIEVLVTLLVVAVGLLGVLAAQTFAIKQLLDAIQRTQAVQLAKDITSELQLNNALVDVLGQQLNLQTASPGTTNCDANFSCSAEQLAANQIASWLNTLQNPILSHLIEPSICFQQTDMGSVMSINWVISASGSEADSGCEVITGKSWLTVQVAGE